MKSDLNNLFIDYFPSPSGDNKELLKLLHQTSKIICDWFSVSEELSPLPQNTIKIISEPNKFGCDIKMLLDDINSLIYSSFNPCHPGSLAHLDPPPLAISIVGDLVAGALNNNLLAEELSPSISVIENDLCKWFANEVGFGNSSGGIAASGGTLNNLNALVCAKFNAGLTSDAEASFIVSEEAHVSFKKCARIIGVKEENIICIETDIYGKMDISKLNNEIKKSKSLGKKIFSIVATLGTTIRGSIDSIYDIGNICKDNNIWFHIDGSIGGIFAISNHKFRNIREINNLDIANSITINPQKLLGITKTSSLLLVDDMNNLKKTFHTGLPYIDSTDEVLNRGELGVQGSRPAEIIKLWLGVRFLGKDGIDDILNSSIRKKNLFENILDKDKFYIYSGSLHIISFEPKNMNPHQINLWSLKLKKSLLENKIMISRPLYKNRYILRIVFGNFNTKESNVIELANFLNNNINE